MQVLGSSDSPSNRRIPNVFRLLSGRFVWLLISKPRQQWIFITDTVDAIYRPDDYFPEAMMDQLADLAGSLPLADSRVSLFSCPWFFLIEVFPLGGHELEWVS